MPTPCPAEQAGSCRRGSPLGGGGAHGSVGKRGAELPLGGAEVAGGHGQQAVCHSGAAQAGPNAQRLGHGAAGPEQPHKRQVQLPQGVAGRRALGLQVPGQHQADLLFRGVGLFQAEAGRPQLQNFFRRLPVGLPAVVVREQLVKLRGQRALALFFAAHRRVGRDHGHPLKQKGIAAPCCHGFFLLWGLILSDFCGILYARRGIAIFSASAPYSGRGGFRPWPPSPRAPRHTPPPPACRTR